MKTLAEPLRNMLTVCWTAPGSRLTMLIVMIREMPLPMPRAVICSPSHISIIVPVVIVRMASIRNGTRDMVTIVSPSSTCRPSASGRSSTAAIA